MSFFPLYLAALGISAGIVGAFGRRIVALGGYVTDFETGIAAAVMVACGYIVVQAAYSALIQAIKPFKSKGPHLTECLSLLMALALVPYLMNFPVPWPHPKLAELEPAIYFFVFLALHGFFKLATLFAATQAVPGTPVRAIPYVAIAFVATISAQQGFDRWHSALSVVRSAPLPEAAPVRVGETFADARALTEGLLYRLDAAPRQDEHLTMRWANPGDGVAPQDTIVVTCSFYGADSDTPIATVAESLALAEEGWFEYRIPAGAAPEGTASIGLFWNADEEPEWVRRTGLRPAYTSGKQMYLSGPYRHPAPASSQRPNLVVILVEGLGADHMELFGYERETSPQLRALAGRGIVWENAFTPCPDTFSTVMSLFSGLPPIMHGNTGGEATPLPPGTDYLPERLAEAGYATIAFTEAEGAEVRDLVHGSGVERGFQLFNPRYAQRPLPHDGAGPAPLAPEGSRVTLTKAAEWIQTHREHERHFLFIRLRELRRPMPLKRYGQGFIKPWERVPQPLDVYDTAVLDIDKQLGIFLDRLREMGALNDTVVAITSPYGLDFSEPGRGVWRRGGPGVARLTEESLRVPLIVSLPEGIGRTRRGAVSLEGLGSTLASLGGVTLRTALSDRSLLDHTPPEDPISVFGDPMEFSLRTTEWRMNWQSGRRPGSLERVGSPAPGALYNIKDYRETKWNKEFQQQEPQVVRTLTRVIEDYLQPHLSAATAAR
ncbi:MAG: sulfatase-like hydrolase/transferase [Candidatus Hydrogenedentes bacterium]|nr:sulfatase-like hydrolase/transferase [Candidatus Hydrogenedentota bacterium]